MLSADYIRSLLPVATPLTSEEISTQIPQALRDASIFSARTIYAGHIADTQSDLARALDGHMSAAEVRGLMKLRLRKLGYTPDTDQQGTLTDLSSDARTSLIVNHQMQRASGYAKWRSDQDPAILDAFPGQELFRSGAPKIPRNWQMRWNDTIAALGPATSALPAPTLAGPFLALKNDPIWPAISRFGSPFPPFDFSSSMRIRNVGRRACRAAGLLDDAALSDKLLQPATEPMDNQISTSSAAGMDPALVKAWTSAFGDRATAYTDPSGLTRVAVSPSSGQWRTATAQEKAKHPGATAAFVNSNGTVISFRIEQGRTSSYLPVHLLSQV